MKVIRYALFLSLLVCLAGCDKDSDKTAVSLADSILSAAVSFQFEGEPLQSFLQDPQQAYISGYFMFSDDLADDIIFGLDIEWFEGVDAPINFPGADWMGLAGISRDGILWYPTGLPENLSGTPSSFRNWQILDLELPLSPNVWYEMRITVDLSLREFVSVRLSGEGIERTIDLSGEPLDYPNYAPFDLPSLTSYAFAARSKEFSPANQGGTSVYFDDISVGIWDGSQWISIFENGFEDQSDILSIPVTLPVIPMNDILESTWYFENDQAKVFLQNQNPRTGNVSLECRADLRVID
jgi:hypothetical protein